MQRGFLLKAKASKESKPKPDYEKAKETVKAESRMVKDSSDAAKPNAKENSDNSKDGDSEDVEPLKMTFQEDTDISFSFVNGEFVVRTRPSSSTGASA